MKCECMENRRLAMPTYMNIAHDWWNLMLQTRALFLVPTKIICVV